LKLFLKILTLIILLQSCQSKSIIDTELETLSIVPNYFNEIDTTYYDNHKIMALRFKLNSDEYIDVDFYESGKKKSIKPIKNSLLHNKHISWFENGNIELEERYKDGVLVGKVKEFFENGILRYQFDTKTNETKSYWINGMLQYEFKKDNYNYIYYYNGNIKVKYDAVSKDEMNVEYRNENGQVVFEGSLKQNLIYKDQKEYTGEIVTYFLNEKISHYENLVKGFPEGAYYSYYGHGAIEYEGYAKKGKMMRYTSYFENGNPQFANDVINNVFTEWDIDGNIIKK
jgi:antitoxin component YwqK of YwqJK toxin-antitoxin module